MTDEREKTRPDYPVSPSWRPASNPGVRLPAPPLEPIPEGDPQTAPVSRADVALAIATASAAIAHTSVAPAPFQPAPVHSAVAAVVRTVAPAAVAPVPRAMSSGYSMVPSSQENLRPFAIERPAGAPLRPSSASALHTLAVEPPAAVMPPPSASADGARPPVNQSGVTTAVPGEVPVSQPHFRPASDGFLHPATGTGPSAPSPSSQRPQSGNYGPASDAGPAAAGSRRAADPTRLLPWLRDKNRRFRDVDPAHLQAMFVFASLQRVPANTIVQPFEAAPTACFAVVEGTLVTRGQRANGSMREIERAGPGELIGLLALADTRPSPYEIVAATTAELITFESDKLGQYLAALHPTALQALQGWMPMLIDHLRTVQQRLARLAASKRSRVEARDDDAWKGGR